MSVASQQPGAPAYPVAAPYPTGISFSDAVATQTLAYCTELLETDPSAINEKGWNGLSPLHKACLRGQIEIIEWCLRQGADVHAVTDNNETPLHYAAKRDFPAVIEVLSRYGADMNAVDTLGKTAAHHAAQCGNLMALLYLESAVGMRLDCVDNAGRSLLHYAVSDGRKDVVQFLLQRDRCPIDLQDDKGDTCLHVALRIGASNSAFLILSHPGGYRLLQVKNKADKIPGEVQSEDSDDIRKSYITGPLLKFASLTDNSTNLHRMIFMTHMQIFFGPFGVVAAAYALCYYLVPPKWAALVYIGALVSLLLSVMRQEHRTLDAPRKQNTIFAGTFFAGYIFTAFCFFTEILPFVADTWIPRASVGLFCIGTLMYMALLYLSPGIAPLAEPLSQKSSSKNGAPKGNSNPEFVELVKRRMDLSNCYCVPCERRSRHPRVKHCKLCEECYEDMDHHCLFLLKCVARDNHRLFVLFVILVEIGIGLWAFSAFQVFLAACPAHPDERFYWRIICFARERPFIAFIAFFNVPSFLWGFFMLRAQLVAISRGGTCYYQSPSGFRLSCLRRICNVVKFLIVGKIPYVKELAEASHVPRSTI